MKTITSEFFPSDRYLYDFKLCTTGRGWAQVDTGQDALYFGTWANPFELKTLCYCEGDVITVKLDTAAEFVTEIWSIKLWNERDGIQFSGIDAGFNEKLRARFETLGLSSLLH